MACARPAGRILRRFGGPGVFEGDAARMRRVIHQPAGPGAMRWPAREAGGNVLVECHGRGRVAEIVVRDTRRQYVLRTR